MLPFLTSETACSVCVCLSVCGMCVCLCLCVYVCVVCMCTSVLFMYGVYV